MTPWQVSASAVAGAREEVSPRSAVVTTRCALVPSPLAASSRTAEIYPHTGGARAIASNTRWLHCCYDLAKLRAKGLVEKLPHSGRRIFDLSLF